MHVLPTWYEGLVCKSCKVPGSFSSLHIHDRPSYLYVKVKPFSDPHRALARLYCVCMQNGVYMLTMHENVKMKCFVIISDSECML